MPEFWAKKGVLEGPRKDVVTCCFAEPKEKSHPGVKLLKASFAEKVFLVFLNLFDHHFLSFRFFLQPDAEPTKGL